MLRLAERRTARIGVGIGGCAGGQAISSGRGLHGRLRRIRAPRVLVYRAMCNDAQARVTLEAVIIGHGELSGRRAPALADDHTFVCATAITAPD